MEDDERHTEEEAAMCEIEGNTVSLGSPVTAFYEESSILITGATGFIGKVLLEKLLRSCPGIVKIYILLRSKKGRDVQQRLQDILDSEAFELIKEECPNFFSKVVAIEGDIALPDVGLSETDVQEVIENVSVVFHSAATVKFDEPLRTAVSLNLMGTKHIFELSKKMKNLKAFVHVSTAYCNCDREEIEEVVYPAPIAPQYILDTFQLMDSQFMDAMTPKLIRGRPNTYTLTKALAETYLAENSGDLPVAIVRPSIVTASWKEPLTGWVDSMGGITGVYFAVSTGLLRTAKMDKSVDADFIPVDIVTNLMISVAWYTSISTSSSVPVYNCTSGSINNLKWKLVKEISVPFIMKNPSVRMFRVPKLQTTTSRVIHFLGCLVNHYIPAFFFDATRVLQGKKPRMIQLYNKVHSVVGGLEYFALHSWKFGCENVLSLYQQMAPKDQMCFNFNIQPLDWPVYIQNHIIGMQQFLMKEDESKLTLARKRLRSLYIKSVLLKTLSLATFLWLVLRHSTRAWKLLSLFGALFRKLSLFLRMPLIA